MRRTDSQTDRFSANISDVEKIIYPRDRWPPIRSNAPQCTYVCVLAINYDSSPLPEEPHNHRCGSGYRVIVVLLAFGGRHRSKDLSSDTGEFGTRFSHTAALRPVRVRYTTCKVPATFDDEIEKRRFFTFFNFTPHRFYQKSPFFAHVSPVG